MTEGVQEWLADTSPAPSKDSEGVWEAWRNGDPLPTVKRRPVSFEIEDDVPVPDSWHRSTKYPWADLEPGQSFYVRAEDGPDNLSAIAGSGRDWCERHRPDCTVIYRKEPDESGVRVWMVEKEGE